MKQDWQHELTQAVSSLDELLATLQLSRSDMAPYLSNLPKNHPFPLRVPKSFVRRMKPGDPNDPLLLQILPQAAEWEKIPGYSTDPLQEKSANPIPGLLHKYHGRVLLMITGACPIHCRYCFRRHFPYENNTFQPSAWTPAIDYIKSDPTISEVILSGGDPLLAKDALLTELTSALAQIPHLKTLRIHSRIPIVLPERITDDFIAAITQTRLRPVLVMHANHSQEIDHSIASATQKLKKAHITLLNQTVLLHKINDTADTLIDLSHRLFDIGILPYYIHLLDKIDGAAHFDVNRNHATQLQQTMLERLPGYLVPHFVFEDPDAKAKVRV